MNCLGILFENEDPDSVDSQEVPDDGESLRRTRKQQKELGPVDDRGRQRR